MDIKIKGALKRINRKLDEIDDSINHSVKTKEDDIKRILEKLVDSLIGSSMTKTTSENRIPKSLFSMN